METNMEFKQERSRKLGVVLRWFRKFCLALGALMIVLTVINTARDLVTGVARPIPAGRRSGSGRPVSKDERPGTYWARLVGNLAYGVLLGGFFLGFGLLIGSEKFARRVKKDHGDN